MTRPTPSVPKAMYGWFGIRHLPYDRHDRAWSIAREIALARLPKKEFFEITAMVEQVRGHLDPTLPIFDCCSGHGLLGMLLAGDERVPAVTVIDRRLPLNCHRMMGVLERHLPRLPERLHFVEQKLEAFHGFGPGGFVASHACGPLTDLIIDIAVRNRARFFVMTCCISKDVAEAYGLDRVHGQEAEINRRRLEKVAAQGYRTGTLQIDPRITPWNTILMGWPEGESERPRGGLRESILPARLPPKLEAADRELLQGAVESNEGGMPAEGGPGMAAEAASSGEPEVNV